MKVTKFYLCFALLFSVFVVSTGAKAAEVIHDYDVRVVVDTAGSLQVTETITVTAEGNQIRRGIYRDFPLYRRTFLGGIIPTDYRIISVMRDGERESYHTEESENNLRLYIGESSYHLPTGKRYVYEIAYKVPHQIFFYDDYDELNWNVIGTGWDFPIKRARAEIILPNNAPILEYSAYTGKALSKENDVHTRQEPGRLLVESTKSLEARNGMTVAVAFPKNYVTEPPDMKGTAFFWLQHPGFKTMLIALVFMMAYYYIAWHKVGRDPKGRGLAPFYDPPKEISPAMAAFIDTMGSSGKQKNMTAAIMSLAAKGYLTIEEGEEHNIIRYNTYTLSRTEKMPSQRAPISEDERIIYDHIKTKVTIKPGSEALVDAADSHYKKLDELCRKKYYHINGWWWLAGLLPLIVALAVISFDPNIQAGFLWMGLLFLLMFGGVSLGVIVFAVRQFVAGPPSKKVGAIFMIFWACLFSIGGFLGLGIMITMISWLVIVCIVAMAGFFVMMFKLMKAPTREGRAIMDHIDGLKYYMEAVEEKILKRFDPPQMSRELYEKYLPYAVALGVEAKWADKFALATAGAATAAAAATIHTAPSWYRGGSDSVSGFSATSMVSNLGASISAASTSNSSGSSGGGSVGGGGGGGGGGGW